MDNEYSMKIVGVNGGMSHRKIKENIEAGKCHLVPEISGVGRPILASQTRFSYMPLWH